MGDSEPIFRKALITRRRAYGTSFRCASFIYLAVIFVLADSGTIFNQASHA